MRVGFRAPPAAANRIRGGLALKLPAAEYEKLRVGLFYAGRRSAPARLVVALPRRDTAAWERMLVWITRPAIGYIYPTELGYAKPFAARRRSLDGGAHSLAHHVHLR